jgi:hypothetical protein
MGMVTNTRHISNGNRNLIVTVTVMVQVIEKVPLTSVADRHCPAIS